MNNPFRINPIKISVINPITKNVTVYGGNNLSFLDPDNITTDDVNYESIDFYPFDILYEIRYKIFLKTDIPIYRQYLYFRHENIENGKLETMYPYEINVSGIIVNTTNLETIFETTSDTEKILDIPIDRHIFNNKNDVKIIVREFSTDLGSILITEICVIDLYDIIHPNDPNIINVLQSEYIRELFFYSFIMKYYPIIPYNAFEILYTTKGDISQYNTLLSPTKQHIYNIYKKEKDILDELYAMVPTLYKKYHISTNVDDITAGINIPTINKYNFFKITSLANTYSQITFSYENNNVVYNISKYKYGHTLYNVVDKIPYILVVFDDVNDITMYIDDNTCEVNIKFANKTSYDDGINMLFKYVEDIDSYIQDNIKMLVDNNTVNFDDLDRIFYIKSGSLVVNINEHMSLKEFTYFDEFIKNMDTSIFKYKSRGNKRFSIELYKYNVIKDDAIHIIPNMYTYFSNNYDNNMLTYYMTVTVTIYLTVSGITIELTNYKIWNYDFIQNLMMTLIYKFRQTYVDTDVEQISSFKLVKKLQDIDQHLFNFKYHDENVPVYAVRCQSDRQPSIYTEHDIKKMTDNKKNTLTKFINFTDGSTSYYACENKKYPYLNFNPLIHPLLYCVPCCKKIPSSEGSIKAKFNDICLQKFKLTTEEVDSILSEQTVTHILAYGKYIPDGRFSHIEQTIHGYMLNKSDDYLLLGTPQYNFTVSSSIISCILAVLNVSIEKLIKNILSVMKNKFYLLYTTYADIIDTYDKLASILTDIFIVKSDNTIYYHYDNMGIIDWDMLMLQLVYITYKLTVFIVNTQSSTTGNVFSNLINIRALPYISWTSDDVHENICILFEHENGMYPLIYKKQQLILDKSHEIINELYRYYLNDECGSIFDWNIICQCSQKEYVVDKMLMGHNGVVYAVILKRKGAYIYLPISDSNIILDEYYNISTEYITDFSKFTINALCTFLKDCSNMKKYKIYNMKYENNYIAIKVVNNVHNGGLVMFHVPSKTPFDKTLEIINVPYDIHQINKVMRHNKMEYEINGYKEHLYKNMIYELFLATFSNILHDNKNINMRKQIIKANNDLSQIKMLLKDYPHDYEYLLNNKNKYLSNILDNTYFDFDMGFINSILTLSDKKLHDKLSELMKTNVSITEKQVGVELNSTACKYMESQCHCKSGKLLIHKNDFVECIQMLSKDIFNVYRLSYIIKLNIIPINPLTFELSENEELNIYQL